MHGEVAWMAKLRDMNVRQRTMSNELSKIRVLAVERIMMENRSWTANEIKSRLKSQYDMDVSRQAIYSDLRAIDRFIPLEAIEGRNGGYRKFDFNKEEEDGK